MYLASPDVDGKVDELRVFLDQILQRVFLQEFMGFLLHVKTE